MCYLRDDLPQNPLPGTLRADDWRPLEPQPGFGNSYTNEQRGNQHYVECIQS